MRPIPIKMRNEMSEDKFYSQCCVTGRKNNIQFHHNLQFGSKQQNEKFCILPLTKEVHDKISKYKRICDWIMWNRATEEEIRRYSKAENYFWRLEMLNEEYGDWTPDWYLHKNFD